jgi:hypothetical protein
MERNSEINFYSLLTVNVHTHAILSLLKDVKLFKPHSHDSVTSSEESSVDQMVCRIQDNCKVSKQFSTEGPAE